MITSSECYLFDSCNKYKNNKCNLQDDAFCIKLFKLNYLYDPKTIRRKKTHGEWFLFCSSL